MHVFLLCRGEMLREGIFLHKGVGWTRIPWQGWGWRRHSRDALWSSSPQKKAPRNSVSSTWISARATPAPSNDPFMPGKCNGEFLQPSPAPDSHQVSEGRRGADRTPCCRVTHLAHRLLRGILVAGRWHVAPAGAAPWAGVLHRPRPWAPPARCCPPAWPGPAATVSTRAHLMCLQGERGGDIMASSGREGGAASALLCTAMAPQWPPGIQLHRL